MIEPGKNWDITRSGDVLIKYHFEDDSQDLFPFGAAVVEYKSKDGVVVNRRLMSVERNEAQKVYTGRESVKSILPAGVKDCSAGSVNLYAITTDADSLALVAVEDVERLLADRFVKSNPNLRDRLERLRDELSKGE